MKIYIIHREVELPNQDPFFDSMYSEADNYDDAVQRAWDLLPPIVVKMSGRELTEEEYEDYNDGTV